MLASHVNTAPVVRDLVEIIEQHGRWRELESERMMLKGQFSLQERRDILSRNKWRPNQEKIQYWGFSYGTVVGATLAAIYPDRVHRMILDGVVDAPDYMAGESLTSLRDTDRLIPAFAQHCYSGGRERCALFRDGGPDAISALLKHVIANVRDHPIGFAGTSIHGPGLITHADLMRYFRSTLYTPLQKWPEVAQIFHELSSGDSSSLAAIQHAQISPLTRPLHLACTPDHSYTLPCFDRDFPSLGLADDTPIRCTDGLRADTQAQQEFNKYAEDLVSRSELMGAAWVNNQLPCTAWHAKASWRYDGTFQTSMPQPVLLIGNSIDPVTPLRSAINMSAKFNGSAVLQIEAEGHCSYATVSMCAGRAIRAYFQQGIVPEPKDKSVWAVGASRNPSEAIATCKADRTPFDGYLPDGPEPDLPQDESDHELWTALVGLARSWSP
jgi:pimeloyl-ACP methyl ester carboxylesterase